MINISREKGESWNKYLQLFFNWDNSTKKFIFVYGFCFFISLLFLLIATKSSPLYPFNNWADANISFTMGKGMMRGKVIYRDLFDHKGPLFYLLFGLGYIISNTTFLGVFIFEVFSFSFFLFFSFKLIKLYLENKYVLIVLPLLAAAVVNLNNFTHGGSAEEFCLPLLTISLYSLFDYFKNVYPKPISNRIVLINGLIAGCVLWTKFSLLGFWLGWVTAISICLFVKQGFVRAVKGLFVFLVGMLLATLPWLIYFGVNHAILDLINAYFIFNFTSYSMAFSLNSIIKFIITGILVHLPENPVSLGLMYFGLIVFFIYKKYIGDIFLKFGLLFCFLFLALSVYGGGREYIYYFLIFSPFISLGLIAFFTPIIEGIGELNSIKLILIIIFIILFVTFSYTLFFHHNIYMLRLKKEDLVQYKYATIINETKNPSLLNYGTLDGGFFTTTGIIPNIRYFHYPNVSYARYPIILDEQNSYIKEHVVDYIVFYFPPDYYGDFDIPYLEENYNLVAKVKQQIDNNELYYLLYRKESNRR